MIEELLRATKGKFFSVDFIKRTTGEKRTMTARLGVTKYLKGGELGYDAKAKGLLPVYEVKADGTDGGYKCIPLDAITEIKFQGKVLTAHH